MDPANLPEDDLDDVPDSTVLLAVAAQAPDAIPDWFVAKTVDGLEIGPTHQAMGLGAQREHQETRYFQWRAYYAFRLLEEIGRYEPPAEAKDES
jgi:hypothetical protein